MKAAAWGQRGAHPAPSSVMRAWGPASLQAGQRLAVVWQRPVWWLQCGRMHVEASRDALGAAASLQCKGPPLSATTLLTLDQLRVGHPEDVPLGGSVVCGGGVGWAQGRPQASPLGRSPPCLRSAAPSSGPWSAQGARRHACTHPQTAPAPSHGQDPSPPSCRGAVGDSGGG